MDIEHFRTRLFISRIHFKPNEEKQWRPELKGGGDEDELVSVEETSLHAELKMKGLMIISIVYSDNFVSPT